MAGPMELRVPVEAAGRPRRACLAPLRAVVQVEFLDLVPLRAVSQGVSLELAPLRAAVQAHIQQWFNCSEHWVRRRFKLRNRWGLWQK